MEIKVKNARKRYIEELDVGNKEAMIKYMHRKKIYTLQDVIDHQDELAKKYVTPIKCFLMFGKDIIS